MASPYSNSGPILSAPRALCNLPDIDGLRAVAVLAVVLFHLDLAGFAGGYVGVDIFFVISGFLISGQIIGELQGGRFSFSGFYARRVRRLLPAVLATVIATGIAAVFLLQPQLLEAFARSGVATLMSAANILFFLESGYWDADADLKPLLHMWSLGVEEQFYLFWPALLVLLLKLHRGLQVLCLLLLVAASLVACIIWTRPDSHAAFYLLPFRVWQFGLGTLALLMWQRLALPEFSRQVLRATGLAMCGVAIVSFGPQTVFPGLAALLPSVGAALVLIASDAEEPSPLLANRPALWFGQHSYALYLVHWPPIALYKAWSLAELTWVSQSLLGVGMTILAVALHRGVEQRFYRRGDRAAPGWSGVPARTGAATLLVAGLMTALALRPELFAQRQTVMGIATIEQYAEDRFALTRRACVIDQLSNSKRCPEVLQQPILFFGNSHEPDAYNLFDAALPASSGHDRVVFGTVNRCGDISPEGDWFRASKPGCDARLAALGASLSTVKWHTIVYGAHQPFAPNKASLAALIERMKLAQPHLKVITVGGFIELFRDCSALINQTGSVHACRERENVRYFAGDQLGRQAIRARILAATDGYIDKVALLCPDQELESCRVSTPQGHPAFADEHHMTREFASYLGNRLAAEPPPWLQSLSNGD